MKKMFSIWISLQILINTSIAGDLLNNICKTKAQCWEHVASLEEKIKQLGGQLETRTTTTGAVFTSDHRLVALEDAWRAPNGLIWGDMVTRADTLGHELRYPEAKKYCESINARLPSEQDFLDLSVYLGAKVGEVFPVDYKPQVLPNLTKTVTLNLDYYRTHLPPRKNWEIKDNYFWSLKTKQGKQAFRGRWGIFEHLGFKSAYLNIRCVKDGATLDSVKINPASCTSIKKCQKAINNTRRFIENNFSKKSDQRITIAGFAFKRNTTWHKLGEAWEDPKGIVWGDIVKFPETGRPHFMTQNEAIRYCQNIGAELPKAEDFDFKSYFYSSDHPFHYVPQVLPNINQIIMWTASEDIDSNKIYFGGSYGELLTEDPGGEGGGTGKSMFRCIIRT